MAYTFDYVNSLIDVVSQTSVTCQDLYNNICQEQASDDGICFELIGVAAGKQSLGPDIQVGITAALVNNWQIYFSPGEYRAYVSGGNLVSTNTNGPVAYSAGVQVFLYQSASPTIVTAETIIDGEIFATPNPPGAFPLGSVGQQIQKSAALAGIALNV